VRVGAYAIFFVADKMLRRYSLLC